MNWVGPISSAATVTLLPLMLIVFRKLFPYQARANEPLMTPAEWQTLSNKYWWVNVVLAVAFFVSFPLLIWSWTRLLIGLDNWCMSRLSSSQFLIKPGLGIWMSAGVFLGLVSSVLFLSLLVRLLLRRHYTEYIRMDYMRYGLDTKKFERFVIGLAILVLAVCGTFAGLACDWYLQVDDNGVAWNPFWSFVERRYSFDDVEKLIEIPEELSPQGNIKHRQQNFILFRDGTIWRSDEMGLGVARAWEGGSDSYVHEMLEFLENKTGKHIIRAQSAEDILP